MVVGTPGRVIDHLQRGTLDPSRVDYLVLDEADEMLTMGFAEDVERILSYTPEYKQVALFSATMPPAIRKLTKKRTCMTRSRSPRNPKPPARRTFRSATSRSRAPARWTR